MYGSSLSFTLVGGQRQAPGRFTPVKDLVLILQEAGRTPWTVWMVVENLAPQGYVPRTFQSVASHYTDSAIPAHHLKKQVPPLI